MADHNKCKSVQFNVDYSKIKFYFHLEPWRGGRNDYIKSFLIMKDDETDGLPLGEKNVQLRQSWALSSTSGFTQLQEAKASVLSYL